MSTARYFLDMNSLEKQKRRNAPKTKAKILAAAQQAFADLGYSQAGIRDIAAIAGVSSTLLLRYYGSKAGLFEAALIEAMRTDALFEKGRDKFGEHVTGLLLDPNLDIKPPAIISLSTGDADAREITTRVTDQHAVAPLAKWLGPPDSRARAMEIVILCTGFVIYTRQLPLMPAPKGVDNKLAKWLAQTLQAIVDQS
ncbi:MAG: TetR/AcrR family transcriptional regulator [Rhodospirillaceae bacterium]|nr:MAG: TetR/AcrR family transcriptional regulator [Rhodospirillaceae bacterium]